MTIPSPKQYLQREYAHRNRVIEGSRVQLLKIARDLNYEYIARNISSLCDHLKEKSKECYTEDVYRIDNPKNRSKAK